MEKSKVTLIGLGQMGSALVRPYLRAGYEVTVWNRSPQKAQSLIADGAVLAESLEAAVDASTLIIVCLADYATSNALLQTEPMQARLQHKTLVQLTTGNGQEAAQGAAWAKRVGVHYLDGAIMDYPREIGKEDCMLLIAGDKPLFDDYASSLKRLGGRLTYAGANPGAANCLDGALLTLYYANALGFMQSAAMLMSENVEVDVLRQALIPFQPVISSTYARCTDAISRQDYSGNEASLHVHSLGVQSLQKRAAHAGIEHGLLTLFSHYVDKTAAQGYEASELPAVFELFRPKTAR